MFASYNQLGIVDDEGWKHNRTQTGVYQPKWRDKDGEYTSNDQYHKQARHYPRGVSEIDLGLPSERGKRKEDSYC